MGVFGHCFVGPYQAGTDLMMALVRFIPGLLEDRCILIFRSVATTKHPRQPSTSSVLKSAFTRSIRALAAWIG